MVLSCDEMVIISYLMRTNNLLVSCRTMKANSESNIFFIFVPQHENLISTMMIQNSFNWADGAICWWKVSELLKNANKVAGRDLVIIGVI